MAYNRPAATHEVYWVDTKCEADDRGGLSYGLVYRILLFLFVKFQINILFLGKYDHDIENQRAQQETNILKLSKRSYNTSR